MESLGALFYVFFRIGIFGFGGGYAMLPLVFQSVQQFGFMSAEEFSNLVALSQVTPGPVVVNAATYVGFLSAGIPGAAAATLGVSIPSFCLVIVAAHFVEKFKANKGLQAVLTGIRPATVGLIASAAAMLARISLINGMPSLRAASFELFIREAIAIVNVLPCIIFMCTILLILKFKVSPIKVIILMGIVGALVCG